MAKQEASEDVMLDLLDTLRHIGSELGDLNAAVAEQTDTLEDAILMLEREE